MFERPTTREIVIKTEETLKNFNNNFDKHIKGEDKKFDLLFAAIKSCPETPHIKAQNSKIDKLITKTDKIENTVLIIKEGKSVKKDIITEIIKLIWVAAVIIGSVIGILTYMDKRAEGASLCSGMPSRLYLFGQAGFHLAPALYTTTNDPSEQRHSRAGKAESPRRRLSGDTVRRLVKVINEHSITKRLGFRFDCKNPDSDRPILDMYTLRSREECMAKQPQLEFLASAISITWHRVTGNKTVYVYDNNNLLVYMIDNKGKFIVVDDNLM